MGSQLKINSQRVTDLDPAALGIIVEKPKFPDYADKSKRLESYANWADDKPIDKNDLVEAGLVYTGVGDSVRCYFCGGGLKNWEQGDNPMEEHARWYPKCSHILLVKGQQYVDKINHGDDRINEELAGACGGIDSPAKQACIEMGFSRKMTEKAIEIYMEKHGNRAFKAVQLCDILFDMNSDNSDKDESPDDQSSGSEDGKDPLEEFERVQAENYQLKENMMCKICMDGKADVLFLPCGHMVSCGQCAPALSKCPMCRKNITGNIKAF